MVNENGVYLFDDVDVSILVNRCIASPGVSKYVLN